MKFDLDGCYRFVCMQSCSKDDFEEVEFFVRKPYIRKAAFGCGLRNAAMAPPLNNNYYSRRRSSTMVDFEVEDDSKLMIVFLISVVSRCRAYRHYI